MIPKHGRESHTTITLIFILYVYCSKDYFWKKIIQQGCNTLIKS